MKHLNPRNVLLIAKDSQVYKCALVSFLILLPDAVVQVPDNCLVIFSFFLRPKNALCAILFVGLNFQYCLSTPVTYHFRVYVNILCFYSCHISFLHSCPVLYRSIMFLWPMLSFLSCDAIFTAVPLLESRNTA